MGARIVIIEDIQEIGDLLSMVLDHPEIGIFAAEDGPNGLGLIIDVVPDLVILDIMLPGIDGWVVYDTVRADPDLAFIPVIVLSVLQLPAERRLAFTHSNIDFYMQKPFDAVKIRRLIMTVLDRFDLWDLPLGDATAH